MSENPISHLSEETKHILENVESVYKRFWITIFIVTLQIFAVVTTLFKNQTDLLKTIEFLTILVISLGLLAWQECRYARKTKYAEGLFYIHSVVHRLRDSFVLFNNYSASDTGSRTLINKEIFDEVTKAITTFANAFSLIKSVKCRACIKLIRIDETPKKYELLTKEEREKILYVETWIRDSDSEINAHSDEPKHWICGNTDFYRLFSAKNPKTNNYFIENNLPKRHNYKNTSFQMYGEPDGKWTLPYKSTIVWPIRRMTLRENHDSEQLSDNQDVLGYLCIDSNVKDIFNDSYDIHFGAIVADSLFVFLRRYFVWLEVKKGEGIR